MPYAVLATIYDYPAILRRPAAEALQRFAEGGPVLVLAWYAFMLSALALVPFSVAFAITPERLRNVPALTIGAAVSGILAGFAQAVGLSRWVFVIPTLAQAPAASEHAFAMLNAFGGVAVGEHLGQLLTAMFVAQAALLQRREGSGRIALAGILTAIAIAAGTGEGLALALGRNGAAFSLATILGFLGLSCWLVASGAARLRRSAQVRLAAA